ncbi:MAG: TonB-dependent receptor, partial [Gammaproteobacteria bacterium]|nr:TonB-dependent receptor [Gammaproteobacteria bacterium]
PMTIYTHLFLALLATVATSSSALADTESTLEEIVVSGLRPAPVDDAAASIAVLNEQVIRDVANTHFEELTYQVPNLNWAGGVSRPRYFQIRGIGERSQYEGAPDPSVGFIIDDMDFSAMGGIATMFDTRQVEVLRGPQGTRYGANALAGLIYVKYKDPTSAPEFDVSASVGSDASRSLGAVAGGSVTETLALRAVVHSQVADGFRDNAFLQRSDTNGRDEFSARIKARFVPNDTWQLDLSTLHVNLDNGYDAFAVDNTLTTQSDRPGRDSQRTTGMSLKATGNISDAFSLVSISSATRSDVVFSFDADWGNAAFWDPVVYDFFSVTQRDRQNLGQEFRLVSSPGSGSRLSWVTGMSASQLRESNDTTDDGNYEGDTFIARITREYKAWSLAVFGDVDVTLNQHWSLGVGARAERRDAEYFDTAGDLFDADESNVGGQLSVRYTPTAGRTLYAKVARGYKAGGFNLGLPAQADTETLLYDGEYLWNYEIGASMSWLDDRLQFDATAFRMQRNDQQVQSSRQLDPNNPATFVFFTDNAGKGSNSGVEFEVEYAPSPSLNLYANIGFLRTKIEGVAAGSLLAGRDQAHAPRYSYALGGRLDVSPHWFVRADVTGKDSFYFSDSHDQQSRAYSLVNLRAGYDTDSWSVAAWVKNLFDEEYAVRGFFFGNEPARDFAATLYTRQGDPRQVGVSFTYRFSNQDSWWGN